MRRDAWSEKLEGGDGLLLATRLRYRALLLMTRSLFWKSHLRRNADLLRITAADEPTVRALMERVERRAATEGWAVDEPVRDQISRVQGLSKKLTAALQRRLRNSFEGGTLAEQLLALEQRALKGAGFQNLLPVRLPEVTAAREASAVLEPLLNRPRSGGGVDAASSAELVLAVESASGALTALWDRVQLADESGALSAQLLRLARTPLRRVARNGFEVMARLVFLERQGRAQLVDIAQARLGPLGIPAAAVTGVMRWLLAGSEVGGLEAPEVNADVRAVLELVRALELLAAGRPPGDWGRLHAFAVEAERATASEVAAVAQVLHRFLRARGGTASASTLRGQLQAVEALAEAPVLGSLHDGWW